VKASPAHTFDTKLRFTGATSPLTNSYTCGTGATLLVVSVVTAGSTNRAGGNPTYNGITLSQADQLRKYATSPETSCELFYLLAPPTGSVYTISVPNTGGRTLYVVASSYKAQAGYTSALDVTNGNTGLSANPSVSVTTTTNGDVIVGVMGNGLTSVPTGRSGTVLYETDNGQHIDAAQYYLQTNLGVWATSWTIASDDWCVCVAAFKEAHLTSASLSVSDYRVNPSQTSLTFSGYWYYDGTTTAPPDGNYAVVIKLSGVQKGSTDTTLVSGAFSINDVTAESTVNSYSYTVEATYMSGAGSFSAVIVDRIKVSSYAVSDSRANINDNVNIDATLVYEYGSTAITTGTITINGYSASHQGSGVYRITRTSASVTSVTYNTVAGSESAYGLNTVNQNGQSTTVIWDRIRVDSLGLTDSRINANGVETSTLYATASLEYGGHTLGSGDSLDISGLALSWNAGNNRFEGTTASSSSVTYTTYNTFTSGNEVTYGITVGNINSQTATLIFDKLQVQSYTVSDSRVNINDNVNIDALIWFDYDNTVCTTATITINGFSAVHQGSGVYRITRTSATVTQVTYNTVACSAESTYGITTVDQNSQSGIVTWDRLQVQSYTVSDSRADVSVDVNIDALVWFDYDNTVCTTGTITINGYSASHIGSGVYRITRTSASVTSVTYNIVACSAESTYGITTVDQNSQSTIVVWDRFEFVSIATDTGDNRIDINSNFELRYQIRYDFDDVTFDNTKGSITGFTWDVANSWWDKTVTGSSSVTSTNYDETYIPITDSTYGLTVKQDVAGVNVITDRIRIDSLGLTDTRINANGVETSTLYATASLEYDSHALGSSDSLTISELALSWVAGNSRFEGTTASSSSVTSTTYNAFTSGNEATYGINAGNINSKTATLIYDKLQVQSYTVSDGRDNINDDVTIDVLVWFDYDNTVCTTGTTTINGYSASHIGSGVYRITRTSASVTSVTYNTVACSAESTYGITTVDQNSQSATVIWDRFEFVSVSADDTRINVGGTFELRYKIRYDFDDVTFDNTKGSISGFTWDVANSWWDKSITGSSSVTSTTYDETYITILDTTYGITVKEDAAGVSVITDRIRIDSLSVIDSRIDINTQGTFYATASLEFDDHTLGSGDSLTLSGYVFSWVAGNNRFEYSSTQSSVTSITVNSFTSGNEATYGITTGNINSQTVTLIWDRIIVYWEQLDDSRVNIGTNIEGRYKAVLQFDNHALGSGDSLSCSWGNLAWDNANNWFDLIHSESTVTGVTISGWGGNEATYGITAITENITESTYIYDRIEIYEADEPLTIGSSNLNSNFDKQINIIVFMILSTLILVSLVSVKKTKKRLLITLIMFFAIVSMMPINPTFATENKGEHPINSVVRIWYKARYDYDDVVFDNSKGTLYINGTLATWNGTGGYWYRDVTSAQIGVKTYVVDQVSDTEYGLTVIVHTCSYITITWVEVTGYNLNLRVMDWDITDSIANAYVCMNNGTENWKTSDINGWANYTLVSGSVTVEVSYFGFWVNETSLTISSDTTMSLQCKLYDVIVNVRENVRNAKLSNVNVTVYNSTNYEMKSGISDNNGQVSLSNLPNNTLTFTQYGGNSYTLVIGNTTEPIGYDDYVFTVICNQNYVGTTSNYSILVWVGGIVIPLEGSFVTKRLKRKMYKKRKKPK
jgi:hypothetical protein